MQALGQLDYAQIDAFCDLNPSRAKEMARQYAPAAHIYTDYKKLLSENELDVIHIMTPHHEHCEMVLASLAHGCYVLCEKPMAIHKADARAMLEAGQLGRLGIVFQNRYNKSTVACKKILASSELGAVKAIKVNVTWYRDASYYAADAWRGKWATEGGGVLINQAIHTIDLAYYLGGPFARIKGSISQGLLENQIEVEDNAHAVIVYANGSTCLLHASNNYAGNDNSLIIQCELGSLHLRGPNLWLEEGDDIRVLVQRSAPPTGRKAEYGSGHALLIDDFYQCAMANKPYWLDGQEAYPALWAVLSTYESARSGQWVPFA